MAKKLFGNKIEPACEYCERGRSSNDHKKILCDKNGIVSPNFSCRKFEYAPLKRKPQRLIPLPKYMKDDFEL